MAKNSTFCSLIYKVNINYMPVALLVFREIRKNAFLFSSQLLAYVCRVLSEQGVKISTWLGKRIVIFCKNRLFRCLIGKVKGNRTSIALLIFWQVWENSSDCNGTWTHSQIICKRTFLYILFLTRGILMQSSIWVGGQNRRIMKWKTGLVWLKITSFAI